jgi:A/G-specific adenine glycosylase
LLPVKEKKLKKKLRWFTYFIIEVDNKILVRKRTENDIWQNLFEFFLFETLAEPTWNNDSVKKIFTSNFKIRHCKILQIDTALPQQLTHQLIKGFFISVKLDKLPPLLQSSKDKWIKNELLNELAFPAFINQYVNNKKKGDSCFLALR